MYKILLKRRTSEKRLVLVETSLYSGSIGGYVRNLTRSIGRLVQ